MWKNLSVNTKLLVGFGGVILLTMMLGTVSLLQIRAIDGQWDDFESVTLKKRDTVTHGLQNLQDGIHFFKNFVLRGGDYAGKFNESMNGIDKDVADYRRLAESNAEENKWLNQIAEGVVNYRKAMLEAQRLAAAGQNSNQIDKAIKGADKPLNEGLVGLIAINAQQTQTTAANIHAVVNDSETWIKWLCAIIVLVSTLAAWVVGRSITQPLIEVMAATSKMARGDMSQKLDSQAHDELGQLMVVMEQMRTTVNNLLMDINKQIQAAATGQLDVRADASQYQGDFAKLVCGVNDTVDHFAKPLHLTSQYVEQLAKGIIPAEIQSDDQGEYRLMEDNLNTLVKTMAELHRQTQQVIQAVVDGKLEQRADAGLFSGSWRELVSGINQIIDGIVLPINEVAMVLQSVEQGDLTRSVQGQYRGQLGDFKITVNNTIAQLSKTMTNVMAASEELNNAAEQINSTSQLLSQASAEQAARVDDTSNSIERMALSISQNAENAKMTDGIAGKASVEANQGGAAVRQTAEAMKSIAGKVGIIDDIAYQTNMLALNAAIEAARAGDHGKGFAVVAAEVRKLAERSQIAAQEIGELAESSVNTADSAGRLLDEIVPDIARTSTLIQEIAAASQAQASGVNQVNTAINQMNEMTQQNASASEQLAATAQDMSDQAEQLQSLMRFFRIAEH